MDEDKNRQVKDRHRRLQIDRDSISNFSDNEEDEEHNNLKHEKKLSTLKEKIKPDFYDFDLEKNQEYMEYLTTERSFMRNTNNIRENININSEDNLKS